GPDPQPGQPGARRDGGCRNAGPGERLNRGRGRRGGPSRPGAVPPQPWAADQLDRLHGGPPLDGEAAAAATRDRRHGPVPGPPREGGAQREAGADRGDPRVDDPDAARDEGERGDWPEPPQGGATWVVDRREGRRGPGLGKHGAHVV